MTLLGRTPYVRRGEPLRYGVRHRQTPENDDSPFKRGMPVLFVAVCLAVLVARGCLHSSDDRPKPRLPPPETATAAANGGTTTAAVDAKPPPPPTSPPTATRQPPTPTPVAAAKPELPKTTPKTSAQTAWENKTRTWLATINSRPVEERTLLERLADAERLGNDAIALDAVRRLLKSSVVADLHDDLALRLGQLNVKLLFSNARTPWTKERTVRAGDNLHRIAREHRTTTASILKLNGLKDANHLQPGQKLRVLDFPDATLVIRIEPGYADLMLKGRLFKRYLLRARPKAATGNYPITRDLGPRTRFAELGIEFAPGEAEEAAMFLAPSSDVTVTAR